MPIRGDITANITGNFSGSVGSVSGAVGSVTGAVGSVTGNVGGNVNGNFVTFNEFRTSQGGRGGGIVGPGQRTTPPWPQIRTWTQLADTNEPLHAIIGGRIGMSTVISRHQLDDIPTNAELATALATAVD